MAIVGVLSRLTKTQRSPRINGYVVLGLLTLILTLIPWVYINSLSPSVAEAGWWNDHFLYRQRLPVSNGSGESKTDFQLKLELDTQTLITNGQMQSSCSDIRFTDHSGKELHYFLEPNTCNTTTTILFVKIPSIPTTGTNIFLYYGNSQATSKSSTSNVFIRELDSSIANWPLDDTDPTQSYARVINQGAELGRDIVINGGFDDSSAWTMNSPANAISDGQLVYTNSGVGVTQNIPIVLGKYYRVTYTITSISSGRIVPLLGGTQGTQRTIPGTYSDIIQYTTSTNTLNIAPSGIDLNATVDNVSVNQIDIPSSASIDSTQELLVDGDMEAADTSAWPVGNSAVPSKSTSDPYGSLQVLRITNPGTAPTPYAYQDVYTVGKTYRTMGYARGDGGSASPRVILNGQFYFTGTASTSWQPFDITLTSSYNRLSLYNYTINIPSYADFDSVSVTEVSPFVGRNTNGVTVGADANGHLERAYSFDGTNDNVNIYSSDLNSAFNPDEGTVVTWAKVANSSVWSDGVNRTIFRCDVDETHYIVLRKEISGILRWYFRVNGVSTSNSTGMSPEDWFNFTLVWSKNSNTVSAYVNGALAGPTANYTSTWNGNFSPAECKIGMNNTIEPWSGQINDVRLYDRALSPEEIGDMYSDETDIQVYATDNYPGKELIRQFDSDITIGSPATAELAPGPIAHWSFDTLEGSTVRDVSGNGNNGTNNGATLLTEDQCISGKCMRFDGDNDSINLSSSPNASAPYTVSFWFKPRELGTSQTLISFNGGNPFPDIRLNTNNKLLAYSGLEKYVYSGKTFTQEDLNKWWNVSIVYDDPNNLSTWKVYVDSVESHTNGANTGLYYDPSGSGIIGSGIGTRYFNGDLDEIKIYPYARSAEEIRMDYLAGAASAGSGVVLGVADQSFLSEGLVGYWKMDETSWNGSAGEVKDASGNGNHGTATGAITGAGKYGSGGSFDGVDDYSQKTNFSLPNTHSFGMWINPDNYNSFFSFSSWWYSLWFYNQRINFSTNNGSSYQSCVGTSTIPLNQWTHVFFTYDSASQEKNVYVNGQLEATCNQLIFVSGQSVSVNFGMAPGTYYAGKIDDGRVYNRTLSPAEVRALYEWAPGPVGHWKFDEGSGTTAIDSSGNGNNGTITSVTWNGGKHGNSLLFDGNDDYVNVGLGQSLKGIRQAITMSSWIHPSAYKSGSFGPTLISNTNNGGYALRLNNGYLRIELRGVLNSMVLNSDQIPLDTWSYVSATYDGSKVIVYLNGVEIGRQNATGLIDNITNSTVCTFIGAEPEFNCGKTPNGDQFHFPGRIDDVRIYNYARTPEQIKEDMMAGRPLDHESVEDPTPTKQTISFSTSNERENVIDGPGADPIAYWDFNERSGTTLTDKSGNEYHGTIVGNPEWVSGKYGGGLAFNGGDYVHGFTLPTMTQFTASAWLYLDTRFNPTENIHQVFGGSSSGAFQYPSVYSISGSLKGKPTWYIGNGWVTASTRIDDKKWHHVVYQHDNGAYFIWVDGRLEYNNASAGTYIGGHMNIIGAYSTALRTRDFGGIMDEVKVYDYVRTPAQIAYDYNRGAPIAHWMMDECQGSTIHDASGNENHGTLTIGPSGTQTTVGTCDTTGGAWANGKVGRLNSSMSFDGVDDRVVVQDNDHLDGHNSMSVFFWARPVVAKVSELIIKHSTNTSDINWEVFQSMSNIAVRINGATETCYSQGGLFSINNWRSIGMVWDGAIIRIYIDGKLNNSCSRVTTMSNSSGNLSIGAYESNAYGFTGQIDDVRIYNYALSADQVKNLYNNGAVSFR